MKWPSLSLGGSELDTEKFSVDSVMKRISLDLVAKDLKTNGILNQILNEMDRSELKSL